MWICIAHCQKISNALGTRELRSWKKETFWVDAWNCLRHFVLFVCFCHSLLGCFVNTQVLSTHCNNLKLLMTLNIRLGSQHLASVSQTSITASQAVLMDPTAVHTILNISRFFCDSWAFRVPVVRHRYSFTVYQSLHCLQYHTILQGIQVHVNAEVHH